MPALNSEPPIDGWNELRDLVYSQAKARGFHDHINALLDKGVDPDEVRRLGASQRVALLTEELGEVVTELRAPEPQQSSKIPDYTALEEEMADVIIRCFELAAFLELDIEGAAKAKLAYNRSRPHKHGGKKF